VSVCLQIQPWYFVAVKEDVKDVEANDEITMEDHEECEDR
jgi:hypothetical protein